ncbi:DUF1127 domain-containing protein [Alphaproteobacteria bacterium GH1-50]|uniref:DUF1127 domain-containing protein n=1 Tax=Kangsaoukella pontilimi TaxID=2691042 RepID=A0A7C9MKR9_9RHOB|nr:DUF1127 domain-containing protein [Kangsaoukella pontilimi]MXQ08695.1 DUF1127 domain-containing protein [Kangsaoukella pontilimi]
MFTATTAQTRPMSSLPKRRPYSPIGWLVRLNAAYRERQAIARLDASQLRDMGLTRDEAETITVADILSR